MFERSPEQRPLLMAAVRLAQDWEPRWWEALGALLHFLGWPPDKPEEAPDGRAISWLALFRRARLIRGVETPQFERARQLADWIFDLVEAAMACGRAVLIEEEQILSDWIELGTGHLLRASAVILYDDAHNPVHRLTCPRPEGLWRDPLVEQSREVHTELAFPSSANGAAIREAGMRLRILVPTGWVTIHLLGQDRGGGDPGGTIVCYPKSYLIGRSATRSPAIDLVRIAYEARLSELEEPPSRDDDDQWAKNRYPRALVREIRKQHPDRRLHLTGPRSRGGDEKI
jgi:hypothetical protein